jgi:hypothetical protein
MILKKAAADTVQYNRFGLHYNLVASGIYEARSRLDPFSDEYLPYIVAGLIVFDMGRTMGQGAAAKYDPERNGFAAGLRTSIRKAKDSLTRLVGTSLDEIRLREHAPAIQRAYDTFALAGPPSEKERDFHVGATKVLHWIAPELFIIVDQNVSRAFRHYHDIPFKNTTQHGYASEKYVRCLKCAQSEIESYGTQKFKSLEPGTPLARLFDKVAFVVGARHQSASLPANGLNPAPRTCDCHARTRDVQLGNMSVDCK